MRALQIICPDPDSGFNFYAVPELPDGTYEAIGPMIADKYKCFPKPATVSKQDVVKHYLIPHGAFEVELPGGVAMLHDFEATWKFIVANKWEGLVIYFDGVPAKINRNQGPASDCSEFSIHAFL